MPVQQHQKITAPHIPRYSAISQKTAQNPRKTLKNDPRSAQNHQKTAKPHPAPLTSHSQFIKSSETQVLQQQAQLLSNQCKRWQKCPKNPEKSGQTRDFSKINSSKPATCTHSSTRALISFTEPCQISLLLKQTANFTDTFSVLANQSHEAVNRLHIAPRPH